MRKAVKKYVGEFVYGWIDGAITTFAVVAWSVWASLDSKIILILWFANLLADGFSMSVWAYLSSDAGDNSSTKKERFLTAGVTYFSFILLGIIPLIAYVMEHLGKEFQNTFLIASILTGLAFLIIWAVKGIVSSKSLFRTIPETLFLWAAAAGVSYYVGDFLEKII